MNSTVFNSELDAFCAKYMFSNRPVSPEDQATFPTTAQRQYRALFEQLLLFDSVAFKVTGENVPLALLISQIGLKGVEQLIEERVIRFVLWTQEVMSMVTDTPGVNPLASAKFNSESHADPGKSAELGLKWLTNKIPASRTQRLLAKVVPLYEPQPDNLAVDAVTIAHSAYQSGRLKSYGLNPDNDPITNVPRPKREALHRYASEIVEYKLLLAKNWSSLYNFTHFSLFSESLQRLTAASAVSAGYRHLAEIENTPDFGALFGAIEKPLHAVPKIRSKHSSQQFRAWLAAGAPETPTELTRRYIDAIANRNGFFDRSLGKITKSIAMTAAGAGLGAAIHGGLPGVAGGSVGKLAEPLADLGLGLLDNFLLDGLLQGWTPKMFFNELDREYRKFVLHHTPAERADVA